MRFVKFSGLVLGLIALFNVNEIIPNPDDDLLNTIIYYFLRLFIPSENYFVEHFERLANLISSRLPFQSFIESIQSLLAISSAYDGNSEVFNFDIDINFLDSVSSSVQLDLSSYFDTAIESVRQMISGVFVIIMAHFNYRQIMYLIRGSNFNHATEKDL